MSRRPGGKTGWLGPAAGRAWRVLAGLGLMIVLAVSAPAAWSAELDLNKAFLFLDSAKPGPAEGIEAPKQILPWTSPEKERVIAVLKTIAAKAPNFIANVTRFGPVHLYRAKPAGKTRANAHASYRALIFNKFPQNTQHLKDSIVHELVHVSDPYGRIANSAAWQKLIHPHISSLRVTLEQNKLSTKVNPRNPKEYRLAEAAGLPSFYAADTINESLAEVAAAKINGWYTPPEAINRFLMAGLLAAPPPGPYVEKEFQRGRAAAKSKQYRSALEIYTALIAKHSEFSFLYGLRANVYFAMNLIPFANMDYTRAIKYLSPYEIVTRNNYVELRARTWLGLKNFTEAERDCRTLIKFSPGWTRPYLTCAMATLHQGNYRQSVADFGALLKIAPGMKPQVQSVLDFASSKLNASGKN